MDPIFGAIQQNLDSALSVPFVSSSVLLGLAFYAYKAAPELPSFLEEMFLNVFFQIFIGFMVLYTSTQNFMLSLVVSVVFIYGMKMLSGVKEGYHPENHMPWKIKKLEAEAKAEEAEAVAEAAEAKAKAEAAKAKAAEAVAEAKAKAERMKKKMGLMNRYKPHHHHGMMGGSEYNDKYHCGGIAC